MTAFSLIARLHLGANSRLALSLPQSRCFNPFSPRQLPPQREPRRLRRKPQNCKSANPILFSPSVSFADSSPSIRSEAPSFIVARAAKPLVFGAKHQTQNVVRQSRTNILPKIHRGAEIRAPYRTVSIKEPRLARRFVLRQLCAFNAPLTSLPLR